MRGSPLKMPPRPFLSRVFCALTRRLGVGSLRANKGDLSASLSPKLTSSPSCVKMARLGSSGGESCCGSTLFVGVTKAPRSQVKLVSLCSFKRCGLWSRGPGSGPQQLLRCRFQSVNLFSHQLITGGCFLFTFLFVCLFVRFLHVK